MINKYKKGFTLLELIVAMSITVIIFSLGFIGMISLRRSLELRNGYNDISSQFRDMQNSAKNVLSDENGSIPEIYALRFTGNDDFNIEYCFDSGNGSLTCTVQENAAKSSRFSDITISSTCVVIGFERRTANLVTLDQASSVQNSQECTLIVGHRFTSNTLRIELNTINNIINYE